MTKTEAITHHNPDNAHHSGRDKALYHGRKHIFPVNHAPIEEGKARRHEENERGGDEHPRNVGTIVFSLVIKQRKRGNKDARNGNEGENEKRGGFRDAYFGHNYIMIYLILAKHDKIKPIFINSKKINELFINN